MKRFTDKQLKKMMDDAVTVINKGGSGNMIGSIAVTNLIIIELLNRQLDNRQAKVKKNPTKSN
jgi:uncharacterized protein YejL (UPF0352 family)